MRVLLLWLAVVLAAASGPFAPPLGAQQWNDSTTLALVRRAVERRQATQADSSLRSYRTVAHGFLFFLGQSPISEDLLKPHLIKADELKVEVYWQAPNTSKQVVLGWRDGSWLPNDMNYHRDHLGIVTNNFGDNIRLGEGDEVRDVLHPLAAAGPGTYDYRREGSLTIQSAGRTLTVHAVEARPRSFRAPAVIGTLFIDDETAELVRFRFSFTPASYRDADLEDISVTLENSQWENRYWLPRRQEIEIRRKVTWLDIPARGIIRGRWEIRDYDLNIAVPEAVLAGPDIGGRLRPASPAEVAADTTWRGQLADAVVDAAEPLNAQEMTELRDEIGRIAGTRMLSGLPGQRLATRSLSDLARVNRVQGLALGAGATVRLGRSRVALKPSIGFGTADERVTGGLAVEAELGATRLTVSGARRIRDFSDWPVIAPLLNSLSAQETGKDYGDWVLLHQGLAELRQPLDGRTALRLEAGVEESRSLDVEARPANGTYRPNPALGAGTWGVARLRLERAGSVAARRDLQGRIGLEGGTGPGDYLRADLEARWTADLGAGALAARVLAGAGTDGLPAWRSFALGGRGTLIGYPFRAFSGRQAALGHVEWRVDVPAPAIPLGSFASTGRTMTLAPFVAAGWTRDPTLGLDSDGIRPTAGVALELLMRLIRIEAGVGLRDGKFGLTVDISRDWWGIL